QGITVTLPKSIGRVENGVGAHLSTETKPQIYRQEALDRMASPEQLDQLMQVVTVRQWAPLGVFGGLGVAALLWSIVGRVPVNVQGRGARVDPNIALGSASVVEDVIAPASGVVKDFSVRRGDAITTGELIGHLAQPELELQLDGERLRVADLE